MSRTTRKVIVNGNEAKVRDGYPYLYEKRKRFRTFFDFYPNEKEAINDVKSYKRNGDN